MSSGYVLKTYLENYSHQWTLPLSLEQLYNPNCLSTLAISCFGVGFVFAQLNYTTIAAVMCLLNKVSSSSSTHYSFDRQCLNPFYSG